MKLRFDDDAAPACDINTTPLIDVMLVLLIMLIVTIPIQLHAIRLARPAAASATPAAPVRIEVEEGGAVVWQGERLATSRGS